MVDLFANDWGAAIGKTFALMAVSSGVAMVLGIASAAAAGSLCSSRFRSRWLDRMRRALITVWVAGMLFSIAMPLILHAAVWESTAGKFGWLMKTMTGGNLIWVGWIHGVHGAAIVAIATYFATRNIAPEVIQHSALDFGKSTAWFRVRLAIARPAVFAAMIIVWLLAATEMSVVNLHSVRTVADQFYLFYALDPNWTALAVTTWLPILIGGVPALLWMRMRREGLHVGGRFGTDDSTSPADARFQLSPESTAQDGYFRAVVSTLGVIVSMLVCQGAIVSGLVMQAGHSVELVAGQPLASWSIAACWKAISKAPSMFAGEYVWTLQLASFTAIIVTPAAWMLARFGRANARGGGVVDAVMTVAFLIPGPVIGLGIVRLFSSGIPGGEMLATQTLIPTMMAVGVRSGVIAYVVMRIGYGRISDSVWQSSRIDCGWRERLWRIELPLLLPSVLIALIASAVVASGDVPAALPVLPPGVTTVGTRLFGLLHSGSRYQEASLAFWYLAGIFMLGFVLMIASRRWRS